MGFYGEILAPLCSDVPKQILVNFRMFCVALVGHNGYQFLAPNLHQHAGFLTKRLWWCHTRLYSITIVRFNDCDGNEEDDEEDDDDDDDDDDDGDDDDDDDGNNKVWWCSSGWGCYN